MMINLVFSSDSILDSALPSERTPNVRKITEIRGSAQKEASKSRVLKNFDELIKPTPFKNKFLKEFSIQNGYSRLPLYQLMISSSSPYCQTEPDHCCHSFIEESTNVQYISTSPDSDFEVKKGILKKGAKSRFLSPQRPANNLKVKIIPNFKIKGL